MVRLFLPCWPRDVLDVPRNLARNLLPVADRHGGPARAKPE